MKPAVSLRSRAHIPEGILHQSLEGELVLLNLHTGVYFGLDAVGTRVWHLIRTHQQTPLQTIVDAMVEEYDVRPDRCADDLLNLVTRMEEHQLLEVTR